MICRQIEIAAEDGKFDAYLSAPETGKGPGVVIVSSIFGVNKDMTDMCDELARQGCVALVQNFFWRDQDSGPLVIEDIQRAIGRVMRIDFMKTMSDLGHGIAEVRKHPNCNGKIAVLGFCFGGPVAWRAACDGFDIGAAVSFHGTHVSKAMRPGDQPKCPVLFQYGDTDDYAPPEELAAVKKMTDATGGEFITYPGVGHGYMMHVDPHNYHAEAARKSWNRAMQMVDALRTQKAS